MPTLYIAIVGAGPAGLMLALSLVTRHQGAARGLDITLYERGDDHDSQSRANPNRSYTIDITGHGRKAISQIGPNLLARFNRELIPFRGIHAYPLGRTLPYEEGGWTGSRGDICSALLHELKALLAGTPRPSQVQFRWNTDVVAIDAQSGTLTVEGSGEAATQASFDLIVGADGAGSLFRRSLEEDDWLVTTRSAIPNYSRILHLDADEASTAFEPSLLHMFSLRPWAVGGAILNGEAVAHTTDFSAADTPKLFYVQMGYWNDAPIENQDAVRRALSRIRLTLPGDKRPHSLGDFVSDAEAQSYAERDVHFTGRTVLCSQIIGGRAVLVGDAAAAFPPVGQGVNAALEAAVILGECLSDAFIGQQDNAAHEDGVQGALQRYNAQWLPEAKACAMIANSVRYGSRSNLLATFALGAISEMTGIEMLGAQLAKDATLSYSMALQLARRRIAIMVGAIAIIGTLSVFWM